MAKTLSNIGISESFTIEAAHISQSIDAFTGAEAYDITLSGSLTITGSTNINGGVTASSYTGSFVGDGSGLTGVTASSTNFANTDLTFTGNRSHDTSGNDLFISVDGNFTTTTVTDAFLGVQAAELTLGFSQSAQTEYTSGGIIHTGAAVQLESSNTGLNGGEVVARRGNLRIGDGYSAKRVTIDNGSPLTSNILSQSFSSGDTLVVKMTTTASNIDITIDSPSAWPSWSTNNANTQFTIVIDGGTFGSGSTFNIQRGGTETWRGNIFCTTGTHISLDTITRAILNSGDLTAIYRFTAVSSDAWHVDVAAKDNTQFTIS